MKFLVAVVLAALVASAAAIERTGLPDPDDLFENLASPGGRTNITDVEYIQGSYSIKIESGNFQVAAVGQMTDEQRSALMLELAQDSANLLPVDQRPDLSTIAKFEMTGGSAMMAGTSVVATFKFTMLPIAGVELDADMNTLRGLSQLVYARPTITAGTALAQLGAQTYSPWAPSAMESPLMWGRIIRPGRYTPPFGSCRRSISVELSGNPQNLIGIKGLATDGVLRCMAKQLFDNAITTPLFSMDDVSVDVDVYSPPNSERHFVTFDVELAMNMPSNLTRETGMAMEKAGRIFYEGAYNRSGCIKQQVMGASMLIDLDTNALANMNVSVSPGAFSWYNMAAFKDGEGSFGTRDTVGVTVQVDASKVSQLYNNDAARAIRRNFVMAMEKVRMVANGARAGDGPKITTSQFTLRSYGDAQAQLGGSTTTFLVEFEVSQLRGQSFDGDSSMMAAAMAAGQQMFLDNFPTASDGSPILASDPKYTLQTGDEGRDRSNSDTKSDELEVLIAVKDAPFNKMQVRGRGAIMAALRNTAELTKANFTNGIGVRTLITAVTVAADPADTGRDVVLVNIRCRAPRPQLDFFSNEFGSGVGMVVGMLQTTLDLPTTPSIDLVSMHRIDPYQGQTVYGRAERAALRLLVKLDLGGIIAARQPGVADLIKFAAMNAYANIAASLPATVQQMGYTAKSNVQVLGFVQLDDHPLAPVGVVIEVYLPSWAVLVTSNLISGTDIEALVPGLLTKFSEQISASYRQRVMIEQEDVQVSVLDVRHPGPKKQATLQFVLKTREFETNNTQAHVNVEYAVWDAIKNSGYGPAAANMLKATDIIVENSWRRCNDDNNHCKDDEGDQEYQLTMAMVVDNDDTVAKIHDLGKDQDFLDAVGEAYEMVIDEGALAYPADDNNNGGGNNNGGCLANMFIYDKDGEGGDAPRLAVDNCAAAGFACDATTETINDGQGTTYWLVKELKNEDNVEPCN